MRICNLNQYFYIFLLMFFSCRIDKKEKPFVFSNEKVVKLDKGNDFVLTVPEKIKMTQHDSVFSFETPLSQLQFDSTLIFIYCRKIKIDTIKRNYVQTNITSKNMNKLRKYLLNNEKPFLYENRYIFECYEKNVRNEIYTSMMYIQTYNKTVKSNVGNTLFIKKGFTLNQYEFMISYEEKLRSSQIIDSIALKDFYAILKSIKVKKKNGDIIKTYW